MRMGAVTCDPHVSSLSHMQATQPPVREEFKVPQVWGPESGGSRDPVSPFAYVLCPRAPVRGHFCTQWAEERPHASPAAPPRAAPPAAPLPRPLGVRLLPCTTWLRAGRQRPPAKAAPPASGPAHWPPRPALPCSQPLRGSSLP